ncbi:unnamed protein product [Didymodactylos carnosus]|uniref:Uncharacterized protein n=1 Tax=Didymodactylos carnosus TaxID=1234261 RepID=A0A815U531_9BILA|nr:unnamed protein product [Didymodactylos carnosus]CAF4375983.1 unnamed protein product [Didymodactylos carnosus]
MSVITQPVAYPRSPDNNLIGESELWLGGLMSMVVFVLIVFAYMFSNAYVGQYPFENAGSSIFSCDNSLYNASFSTSMQSLTLPPPPKLEVLFRLLNEQVLTLHVSKIQFSIDNIYTVGGIRIGTTDDAVNNDDDDQEKYGVQQLKF